MAFTIIGQRQALLQSHPPGKHIHAWFSCIATPITILELWNTMNELCFTVLYFLFNLWLVLQPKFQSQYELSKQVWTIFWSAPFFITTLHYVWMPKSGGMGKFHLALIAYLSYNVAQKLNQTFVDTTYMETANTHYLNRNKTLIQTSVFKHKLYFREHMEVSIKLRKCFPPFILPFLPDKEHSTDFGVKSIY